MSQYNSSITSELATVGSRKISVNGMAQTRQILMPAHSAKQQIYLPIHRVIPTNCTNSALFSGSTVMQTVTVQQGDLNSLEHLHAKITIQVSGGSVVLAQLPFWFNQINMRSSDGNALIASAFGDTMMANLLSAISMGKMKTLYKSLNIDSSPAGYLGTTNALAPGTYTFFLPLFSQSIIGNFEGLELSESKSHLSFDIYPTNPIVSGTGTISMSNLSFCVECNMTTDKDKLVYQNRYKQYSSECVFLDPVSLPYASRLLTAGQVNTFSLLQVSGLCSHQLVVIRPIGSMNNNVGSASFNWLNVGDMEGASFDLQDNSGNSIWGSGAPVGTRFMRTHISADMSDNAFVCVKPAYYITYCDDIRRSLSGQIKGAYKFDGSSVQLALTLPPAPIQEIQTVSFSATPSSSGNYRFSFRGEISVDLSASATPAQMSAALQGLKGFASQFITAVCSASVSAGSSFTMTFTHPATSGLEGDLVSVVSDGLAATSLTSRTLAGTAGLSTGTYDVMIYSYLFRSGSYVSGRLRSDLM